MVYMVDYFTPKRIAKCFLIENILNQSCFDELRTKQQLGYVVFFYTYYSDGVAGIKLLVQSNEVYKIYIYRKIQNM